ncbi:MAG: hypothetical protein FJW37_14270, partial [Acidobacteria bacterium]|nr:hypothetical protein [Acidobacteriota bacterium]
MSRRRKIALAAAGGLLALLAATAAFLALVARSDWFRERVRQRIVRELERATGGRVEAGSFDFDWRTLRAELNEVAVRGTEPEDAAPLFAARRITVGLKVLSVLRRAVDIQALELAAPRIHLILYPNGGTNIPGPKLRSGRSAIDTILELAVDRV